MSETAWLTLYCLLILLGSLFGGWFPFLTRPSHGKLQLYLSASAGVMLGAAFFHIMPDAMEKSGAMMFGWWMALAVVGLFSIERFLAPHTHEVDHHCDKDHPEGEPHGDHDHNYNHASIPGKGKNGAAAPALAGWMAVLGLTIHTFTNGVGLAGQVQVDAEHQVGGAVAHGGAMALLFPGIALFLAIVLHKPADALAISTVLSRKGVTGRRIALVQFGFALMVPVGVVAFALTEGAITERLRGQLTGAALAFSAGTFLFIALSDLLPEVQFHRHDRVPLFTALVAGVILMGGIALLEPHEEPAPAARVEAHNH